MTADELRTKLSGLDNWAKTPADMQEMIVGMMTDQKYPVRLSEACEKILDMGIQGYLSGTKQDFDALIELRNEANQRRRT